MKDTIKNYQHSIHWKTTRFFRPPLQTELTVIPPADETQINSQAEEALKMLMSLMNQQVRLNNKHSRQKSPVSILAATSTQTMKGFRIP